jgi:peptide-methionine (S)-S-oxide reductase
MRKIVFAGGCFWGVEAYFNTLDGVVATTVGYANGHKPNPSYEEVCTHTTGHAEACAIDYDETKISLGELLSAFWRVVDPTLKDQQGHDVGNQYRTGIYYVDGSDLAAIIESRDAEQKKYPAPIVTEIEPLGRFYTAEEYHQDYLDKNPGGYCHIPLDLLRRKPKA